MRKELKNVVEELVIKETKKFKSKKTLKRIVLHTTCKISNETLVFNYTQNRFYNQQYYLGNIVSKESNINIRLPIEVIKQYGKRDMKKGDCAIDLGAYLKKRALSPSDFLEG